jgi:predicted RNase H-like HicB family nuclease
MPTQINKNNQFHNFMIEIEQEDDGRWIAEIPDLPGVLVYGNSQKEAISNVKALALRVIADNIEAGNFYDDLTNINFIAA